MYEEAEFIKNIAAAAQPITKAIVDQWIAPKIKTLGQTWVKRKSIQDHFFENKFQEYLEIKYRLYSVINIIAFRNQQRKLIDIYEPLKLRKSGEKKDYILINNYVDELLPKFQYVLITDTAGMGKSTIAKFLFIKVIEENKGIPLFIDLRRLNNDYKIQDLIFDELKMIYEEVDKNFILDLLNRGDFIVFLDGYDEISFSAKNRVTTDIQRFIEKAAKNKFLLTSRPEPSLSAFGSFKEFNILPLAEEEAFSLLTKYDNDGDLSKKLISKLNEPNIKRNVSEFLTNPLLVSLLYTAFEYKHKIPLKKTHFL